jgi:hypothetical protein
VGFSLLECFPLFSLQFALPWLIAQFVGYTATWDEVHQMQLVLHKVVLPETLISRARRQCDKTSTGLEDLIQQALAFYLEQQEQDARSEDQPRRS